MKFYEIDENPERDLEYAFAKSWELGDKYKRGRIKKKDLFSPEYFTSLEKISKNTPSGTNLEKTTDQKKKFKEIFRHIEKLFDHPLPIEIIKLRFGVDGSDGKTWEETYNILKDKYPHLKGPSSIRKIEQYAFERIRANIPNFPHLKDLMYDDTQNNLKDIDIVEYADRKPAGDHGEFALTVQKTGATPPFIAHGVHKHNSKQQRKAGGKTQDDAIQTLKDLIDKEYKYSDTVASLNKTTSLLFNTEATGVFFVDPYIGGTFYAKVGEGQQGPILIVGKDEYGPELLVSDGFKKSSMRNTKKKDSEEAIRQMVIPIPAKELAQAGFKQNGRYIIRTDQEYKDRDNHTVYPLTLSSVTVNPSDKQVINKPALTVGTVRENTLEYDLDEAAGVGIVTKQNATKDIPVGSEYMNVKKLHLNKKQKKK